MAVPGYLRREAPPSPASQNRSLSAAGLLWWLPLQQRGTVLLAMAVSIAGFIANFVPPHFIQRVFDDGIATGNRTAIISYGAALTLSAVVAVALSILRHNVMTRLRAHTRFTTLRVLNRHIAHSGAALTRRISSGELNSVASSDLNALALCYTGFIPGVAAILGLLVAAVILWQLAPLVALVVLLGTALSLAITHLLARYTMPAEDAYREQLGQYNNRNYDVLSGLRVLTGLGGKARYAEKIYTDSTTLRERGVQLAAREAPLHILGEMLPHLVNISAVLVAAHQGLTSQLTAGEVMQVIALTLALGWPVMFLTMAVQYLPPAIIASRRIVQVLNTHSDIVDQPTRSAPPGPADLLDPSTGVYLSAGSLVGLAVQDAADAEALLDRLARFTPETPTADQTEPHPAAPLWAGQPLHQYPIAAIRQRIRRADAHAHLFEGPLRDTLTFGKNYADDDLTAACDTAHLTDVISALPDGLATHMSPGAKNVSGGQRQRIRLARALLGDPEVLLLAEPTSALDATTESAIAHKLARHRAGRTTLIVSTSPLLLAHCDLVHVWPRDGALVTGTPTELVSNTHYQRLVLRHQEIT